MIPFVTEFEFTYGKTTQLSPLVRRVIANNPGPFTFTGTGTYLVGDKNGVAVIDPGPADPAHIEAIIAAAPGPIEQILITHTHLDHSAGAPLLQERTQAPIFGFAHHSSTKDDAPPALDEGADFDLVPDQTLSATDHLAGASHVLRVLHTPGHTDNHLCFALEEEGVLFSGDHVMGWSTTVVAPPDGNMKDYMESLAHLSERKGDHLYLPTHGAPIEDPRGFVTSIIEHRQYRDQQILSALSTSAQATRKIAETVYGDLPSPLLMAATLNVQAHLEQHLGTGRVVKNAQGHFAKPS